MIVDGIADREQSLSRFAAPLHSGATLSLPICADWRQSVVETRTGREWLPALSADNPQFRRLLESMDWLDE